MKPDFNIGYRDLQKNSTTTRGTEYQNANAVAEDIQRNTT